SEASDPSGIGENIIEYLLVQGGVSYPLRSKVCYAESLCSFELGELITVDPDTVLQYRARAADNAGNENVSDNGKWRFLTDHPLANFVTKSLILTMGSSYLAKVHVRNLLDEADTITINLEGYQYAEFLPYQEGGVVNDIPGRKNGQLVVEDLEPGDTREFSIKILSSEPRVDTLNLTATSTVEPTLDDKHGVTIRTEYPPEFPGLAEWAVVMLVLLSGGVYFWKVRV
ncbi:MAG: hypothetical protein ACE5GI_06520, partial [Candidatus Aminicenantales bacterium]